VNGAASPPDVELQFPPLPEYVGLARQVFAALVRLSDLAPHIVDDVKLAVSEACTNAATVTAKAGSEDPVVVRGALAERRIHVSVMDRGAYRDLSGESGSSTDSLDFSFERGLSLPLLRGLVDDLDIRPRDGGGNVLVMTLSDRVEEGPSG
jgi:serine/threonine-protein kinase RsbW